MNELSPNQFHIVSPLFHPLDHYLAIQAVLNQSAPGRVFVDRIAKPDSAIISMEGRNFIAGSPKNEAFNKELRDLLINSIFPAWLDSRRPLFFLNYPSNGWEDKISEIFPNDRLQKQYGQTYECQALAKNWRAQLPNDFTLDKVDERIVTRKNLYNLGALKKEMCSEHPSVDEFLSKSFGICLRHNDELVGWCLSEYNCGDRCEVSIEVMEEYRRLGFGTLMSLAFVEMALLRGVARIGWHCWKSNRASSATAIRAGFHLINENPVHYVLSEKSGN